MLNLKRNLVEKNFLAKLALFGVRYIVKSGLRE